MDPRRIDGFFYGLFMDAEVLRQAGAEPSNIRRACVADFELQIGQRACLVRSPGAQVFGMVISLTHAEFDMLYSAPGLEAYRPEAVLTRTSDGGTVPALCFNLVEAPAVGERNAEYAVRLRRVLEKLGFPAEYIASVK